MSDTYTIPVACTNCDYSGTLEIQKGVEFTVGKFRLYSHQSCPTCGCNTLIKRSVSDRNWLGDDSPRFSMMIDRTEHLQNSNETRLSTKG